MTLDPLGTLIDRWMARSVGPGAPEAPAATPRPESISPPALYQGATLDGLRDYGSVAQRRLTGRMRRLGHRYLDRYPALPRPVVILAGGYGTGKTHWLWAVARALAARGVPVRVWRVSNWLRLVGDALHRTSPERQTDLLERYARTSWLGLDEWSAHALGGAAGAVAPGHRLLLDVLEARLLDRRPTVITTNAATPAERVALFGPALCSRFQRDAGIIETGCDDYRALPEESTT